MAVPPETAAIASATALYHLVLDLLRLMRFSKSPASRTAMGLVTESGHDPVCPMVLAGATTIPVTEPTRGLVVTPVEPPLLEAICRLVRLLDHPRDIPVLAPLLLREITYRVLTGPQGGRLHQRAASGAPAERIAQSISFIEEKLACQS